MAYYVKFKDKDDGLEKRLRFIDRYSAEQEAERLQEEGCADVVVELPISIHNPAGYWMRLIGFGVIVIGFIIGLISGMMFNRYDFSAGVAFCWWIGAGLIGALFIGLSEIIRLLDQINGKLGKKEKG